MTEPDTHDLDELAEWIRSRPELHPVKPGTLQRPPYRLTWNAACSTLEALEKRGDLERIPGPTLAWKPTPPSQKPGRGYALPLTPKEHGALLRALEERRHSFELLCLYESVLREMRTHAAARPQHEIAHWVDRLDKERDAFASEVGRSPEVPSPDADTLRAIRSRLKRPT